MPTVVPLTIESLGHRGDGIAAGPVFVPYTAPGDAIEAEVEGERGRLIRVITAGPGRTEPFCRHFTACGGCATQHLDANAYRAWKRQLVVQALRLERIEADVAEPIDAHGEGRRRATFHARRGAVGFARARSHDLIDLDACPLLNGPLNAALPACRAIARALGERAKPLDLLVTATSTGLDIDLRGAGALSERLRLSLVELATRHDLARLSNHGDILVERRPPIVRFGRVDVAPPPGSFLQATTAADTILGGLVSDAAAGSRRVADLFSGCGTLGLVLAERSSVQAIDSDKAAIGALDRAVRRTQGLKPVTAIVRDLFHRPLLAEELRGLDAVVLDPPRAGAEAQMRRLAASAVPLVLSVSCNPATFARDAAILIAGGYAMGPVTPVDQFRHAAHVELFAAFHR